MLWVQTGNGVAITSDRTIEGQNPHVVLRNIDMPEAKNHNITMAWRKNNYNPAIAIFMEMLEKKLTKIYYKSCMIYEKAEKSLKKVQE